MSKKGRAEREGRGRKEDRAERQDFYATALAAMRDQLVGPAMPL